MHLKRWALVTIAFLQCILFSLPKGGNFHFEKKSKQNLYTQGLKSVAIVHVKAH